MNEDELKSIIEDVWNNKESLMSNNDEIHGAVMDVLSRLDSGSLRVCEKNPSGVWEVNSWVKKAVLLFMYMSQPMEIAGAAGGGVWWDRVDPKFHGWSKEQFISAGIRCVPGSVVRYSAYLAPNVVLMPSFINIGAHVDVGTMIDTWATV